MPTETIGENTGDDFGGNSIDNFIDAAAPNTNNEDFTQIRIDGSPIQNGLFSFPDITGITGPVVVSAASLNIYQNNFGGGTTYNIEGRKILKNWVGAESTYNIFSTGNNWTTPGCLGDGTDRNATLSFDVSVDTVTDEYKVLTGAQIAADCETDINGSTTHYGWVAEAGSGTSQKRFTDNISTDGRRPFLSVTYTAGGGPTIVDETITEGLILGDQNINILILLEQISEGLKLGDTVNEISILVESLTESLVLGDFESNQVVFTEIITEGLILSDIVNSISVLGEVITEGLILGDFDSDTPINLIEGPIKITVSVKQPGFLIETKQATILLTIKKPNFTTEIE